MIIPSKLKVGGHTYKVLQNYRFTQGGVKCQKN